ncbi:nucleoside hydrolase [filamentous cyanobacterium LEGE 11480]|uniref:Nucleoside hydrolase n=1 Tax=Romeriopsis navalis LEGE 11480 TaxID=2777977 RepID=A0A928VV93_9CYAN|nr:nucleoside hydrolase [Romeriopsis navalis]MBE9033220.1 nucleoside hydrolase [Romeriopsis navalis LEGE 11480]
MALLPLIIDCDPGVDDAIALLLALAAPELDILGIVTVGGNVPLSVTSANARRICELAQCVDVPVFEGCPRPILRQLVTAEEVHGVTGLIGVDLPPPTIVAQPEHGVAWMIRTLLDASEPVVVATLGPMTNLAMAIVQAPQIIHKIQRVVIMGGAITHGNITPSAEFNFYCDPHAAQIIFTAGLSLTLISLDVTHTAIATPERLQALRLIGQPIGPVVADLLGAYGAYDQQRHGFAGAPLHDPCVIAYLLMPELFQTRDYYVEIETISPPSLGRTIVDWWQTTGRPANAKVAISIDAEGFYQFLTKRLQRFNHGLN